MTRHQSYNPLIHQITLLEASKVGGGASGKAGGLLARWAYPSNLVSLSYNLHAALAEEHHGAERWGYRRVHCGQLNARGRSLGGTNAQDKTQKRGMSVSPDEHEKAASKLRNNTGLPKELDWFASDCVKAYAEMGDPSNTAQVHPYHFTTSMAALAEEKGVNTVLGSVSKINQQAEAVVSITYQDKGSSEFHTIPATDVVIAAGPWTKSIYPSAPISALRAHSVTIRPSRPISAYAIFTEISLPPSFGRTSTFVKSKSSRHKVVTPEIYARPNNEAYACGEGDTLVPLPKTTDDVAVDDARCQDIIDYVSSVSDELRDGTVTARQACYLPTVEASSQGPLIGNTNVKGLLIAAGHSCWGIQNAPGTGKLIAEILYDGKAKSAGIESLDPRKSL